MRSKSAGNAHSRNRIVEILDIDFEKAPVLNVGVHCCNVAPGTVMIEVIRKFKMRKELGNATSLALALIGRDENPSAAASVLQAVVRKHCSWRPYSRFQ